MVLARRRTSREFIPATISDTEGHRIQVRFDDGAEEWTTAAALALPLQSPQFAAAHPAASPPAVVPAEPAAARLGWNPWMVLGVGGMVVALVAVLFFLLGKRF